MKDESPAKQGPIVSIGRGTVFRRRHSPLCCERNRVCWLYSVMYPVRENAFQSKAAAEYKNLPIGQRRRLAVNQ